jgi:hypothetical protein
MSELQGQVLDLANVITVTVLPTPASLGAVNINTIALFTKEAKPSGWTVDQIYGVYLNASDVATDFGGDSDSYAIAQAIFNQVPNPVGSDGYLVIIPRLQAPSLETVRDAIDRTKEKIYYYGILIDEEMGSAEVEFAALALKIHGLYKMFGYCSSDVTDLEPDSMLDEVRQLSESRVRCFYHGNPLLNGAGDQQTQIFSAAYLGRGLSVNFGGIGTSITMHGKQLVGIAADQTIGQTQLNKAKAAGIDVYVSVAGVPMAFCSEENIFFDEQYNKDWFMFALQVGGFNYLIPTQFKIPQTEEGMSGLKDAYRKVSEQAKTANVIAPGEWNSAVPAGVPQELFKQNIRTVGYFIWSLPVAQQAQSDRAARKAPLVQIAAKLAGAIHKSNVLVQMEQ